MTFEQSINKFLEFSIPTFKLATSQSSLLKLESEIKEVLRALDKHDKNNATEEYVDCIMCIFDSAIRSGIHPKDIFNAFERKRVINKRRCWIKNKDNTYTHSLECRDCGQALAKRTINNNLYCPSCFKKRDTVKYS